MIAQRNYSSLLGPSLVALVLVLCASTAAAQDLEDERCEDDARTVCAPRPSLFRLFGSADFAGSNMHSSAPDVRFWTTNTGFSDSGAELQGEISPFHVLGTDVFPTTFRHQNFELQFWAAAARGDWLRNQELAPSLQAVTGGGFTYIVNTQRLGGFHQWAGHDGSIGFTHSGLQAEAGAGCLDPGEHGEYVEGFPLLAAFDCEETWGSAGWQGRGWIGPIGNWVDYFNAVGSSNFSFDFWRVPQQFRSGKPTIGDFQVFGVMSDHGSDQRKFYGSVTPGGSGDPQLEGYPMGLDVHFNAYSFQVPSVARGFIWEGLLVNNSEEVYGVPLDYDSLFFGMMIRPLRAPGRRANPHAIPELGAVVHNEIGRTPTCDGAIPVPQSHDCAAFRSRSTHGFGGGTQGHIFLKTPIGDLRNKHFSDPASPFFAPGHPDAGDTITFNRMSMCSFRCTIQQFIFDARKGFGVLAAKAADALDGRDPVNLTPFTRWELFRQFFAPDGSELLCDPTQPTEPGCFGYRVPGDWAYSNRPPGTPLGPDTLWIDNCRPPTSPHPGANQCTGLWADTLPDRTANWTQNVIWPGAGPFPLQAGDTTSFVVVTFAAPDSATLMSSLNAFYNFYLNDFYLGPGLPSPPGVVTAMATGGSARLGETTVTLFLDNAAEDWRDPFALKVLEELRSAAPGTLFDKIARADPTAADNLESIINSTNVDTVYVFKSCDDAASFTADHTGWECEPSPARSITGERLGTGWQAYDILTPTDGSFPTTYEDDDAVAPGRTYLYSLVAQTDGIELNTQYWADIDGDGIEDEIRDTTLSIVPAGLSGLSTSTGVPFAVEVYVPASEQAGSELAIASLVSRTGPVPFDTSQVAIVLLSNAQTEGRFRLVFGSDATASEYRSSPDQVDSTVVELERSVVARMPDGSIQELISDTVVFRSTLAAGIPLGEGDAATQTTTLVGGVEVTVTDLNAKTGILLDGASGEPLFVSSRLQTGKFTPSEFLSHPAFTQFIVEVDDDPGEYVTDFWAIDGEDLRGRSDPSVEWIQGSSTATGAQFGTYFVDWGATIFGDELPLVDVFNPLNTVTQYEANLNARPEVSRTEVNQEVLDAIKADVNPTLELDDLIEVKLPLTVRNLAFGEEGVGTAVRIALLATSKLSTVLLGNAPDSVTVAVPADVWIPGETLIFLEEVEFAQTNPDGTLQRDGNGQPVLASELRVTWSAAVLGCGDPRTTCNPVSGPRLAAIPGYVAVRPNGHPTWPNGWDLHVVYMNPFTSQSSFDFDVSSAKTGEAITAVTSEALSAVRVVPNPYIGRSAFEFVGTVRRLMFTNLPPSGTIQIFTVTGQFVQRMSWGPSDLAGNGDLFWNMETREGNLIASGLYIYVVTATDPGTGQQVKQLKKFIVIR